MLLQPKKSKYKKQKKNFLLKKVTNRNTELTFGTYGLKVLESTRITARQIESVRQNINRSLSRKGKVWVKIFPHIPVTSTPTENRMGKGKGAVDFWCSAVKGGTVIIEIGGNIEPNLARISLKKGSDKLRVKTKIIIK